MTHKERVNEVSSALIQRWADCGGFDCDCESEEHSPDCPMEFGPYAGEGNFGYETLEADLRVIPSHDPVERWVYEISYANGDPNRVGTLDVTWELWEMELTATDGPYRIGGKTAKAAALVEFACSNALDQCDAGGWF